MDNDELQIGQQTLGEHLIKSRATGERIIRLGRTDSGSRAERRYAERQARIRAKREAKGKK